MIVEDDLANVKLIKKAFVELNLQLSFIECQDGDETVSYFKNINSSHSPLPDIILLDLNLPKLNGFEVIKEMKNPNNPFKKIPIIVLSTSTDQDQINHLFEIGCNSYMIKPKNFSGYKSQIKSFYDFWFSSSTLPKTLY